MTANILLIGLVLALLIASAVGLRLYGERIGGEIRSRLEALEKNLDRGERLAREESSRQRTETQELQRNTREEITGAVKKANDALLLNLQQLTQSNAAKLDAVRETVESRLDKVRAAMEDRLGQMRADNNKNLEQMRHTVDEKLQGTLEKRLGESFKLVTERLEQVHKGLGEMQTLAAGVGDLKRVLTNVKTRGVMGEVQLNALLQDLLAADQYAANVVVQPGSAERVDFAIRLPGRGTDAAAPLWLPIDAKFPMEDYQRLVAAQDAADAAAVAEAGHRLETTIRTVAAGIAAKYIHPPETTDFAFLFLPTESLFAEVLRRPGLFETIQRVHRVTIAGPTTLASLLMSLQMGFRTLAIEQRSSEVWDLLSRVKTEFGKFGEALARVRKKLHEATTSIEDVTVRKRAMESALKTVQTLPTAAAPDVMPPGPAPENGVADAKGTAGRPEP